MQVKRGIEAGFTVVELLCTLSVVGLLLTLALPSMSTLLAKANLSQVTYQLTAQLDEAQLLAMAYEQDVTVSFRDRVIITELAGKEHARTSLPEAIYYRTNYMQNKLTFRKTGQVRGGTIVLYRGKQVWLKVIVQVASGASRVVVQH
jgi:prepilin-type N-terminal cleavage/methylation domain-containing protein